MIAKVARILQRRNPQREAALALARITTLTDIGSLPWDSGVYDDRRSRHEVPAALGVWVTPLDDGENADDVSMESPAHAVCCDLRAKGFGVLSATPITGDRFIVAIPNGTNDDDSWKYFIAKACHQTPRPGGWHLLGLCIERLYEPSSAQSRQFRGARNQQSQLLVAN
jgi:hypothetical protein